MSVLRLLGSPYAVILGVTLGMPALACGGSSDEGGGTPCSGPSCADTGGSEIGAEEGVPDADALPTDGDTEAATDAETGPTCDLKSENTGLRGGSVYHVSIDPRSGALLAASGSRVFRSTDFGKTWERVGQALNSITQFAYPKEATTLLAATTSGIQRSLDSGKTWSKFGLDGLDIASLVVHSAVPQRMYAAARGTATVFRSSDGGVTWMPFGAGLPYADVTSLRLDAVDPDLVLAGANIIGTVSSENVRGRVVRTTTGGASWDASPGIPTVRAVRPCRTDATIVYVATDFGLYRSTDGGKTVTKTTAPISWLTDVATGATCNDLTIAGRFDGIRFSSDGGATATAASALPGSGKPDFGAQSLVVDPADPKRIAAGFLAGVATSTDTGATWTVPDLLLQLPGSSIAAARPDGVLWLGTQGLGAWTRESLSKPWTRVPITAFPLSRAFEVFPDPYVANRVFIGGWSDLYRSTDGATFTKVMSNENVFGMGFDPANPNNLWLGTQLTGVYRSTDGGLTFTAANEGLSPWPASSGSTIDVRSIIVLPSDKGIVAGTFGNGIIRRASAAGTWAADTTLAGTVIRCLVSTGDALYACVREKGVARSTDDGKTWAYDNTGLSTLAVTGAAVDPATKTVYLTTEAGIFTRGAASWSTFAVGCAPAGSLANPFVAGPAPGRRLLFSGSGELWSVAL